MRAICHRHRQFPVGHRRPKGMHIFCRDRSLICLVLTWAGGAHLARLRVISTACVPNLGEITKISGAAALNVTILRFISSSELFIAA